MPEQKKGPGGAIDPRTECSIEFSRGYVVCESFYFNNGGTSYVRIVDTLGNEKAYWTSDEWRDEPDFVMGAIFGAMMDIQ